MRFRLIDHIPYKWALIFAGSLFALQMLEHTNVQFATFTFVYIMVATTVFNLASGLTTLPGTYIFFTALLTGVIGVTVKALVGEPGESLLRTGPETMGVYVLSTAAMAVPVLIERKFRARRPFLPTYLRMPDLRSAFLGSALAGTFGDLYLSASPTAAPGSIASLLSHLDAFTPLAIVLGTIDTVRRSNGRRNMSPLLLFLLLLSTARGVIGFSKEGMFGPAVGWVLGLIFARYRFKIRDFVILALLFFAAARYAVPWSQWGRWSVTDADTSLNARLAVCWYLMNHFDEVRSGYEGGKEDVLEHGSLSKYYDTDVGQFERLTLLPVDDALIDFTDKNGPFGFKPVIESIEALVPHFLWKDKPVPYYGNVYTRQLGGNQEDTTTGIAIGIAGDAYREGGLLGVLVVQPLVLTVVFLIWSYVLGKVPDHEANLVMVLILTHIGPEDGLFGMIGALYFIFAVLFCAALCRYVFPLIGSVLTRTKASQGDLRPAIPTAATSR